jgi:hypothetical protein
MPGKFNVDRIRIQVQCIPFFKVEDGGGTVLRNVDIRPPHFTVQQPRKPRNSIVTAMKIPNLASNKFFPKVKYNNNNNNNNNNNTSSRPALGPTQPPIQWVPGALSLGVKRRGVKLTTHLHLTPRSRMRGTVHALPQ